MKLEKNVFLYYINKLAKEQFDKKEMGVFLSAVKDSFESLYGINIENKVYAIIEKRDQKIPSRRNRFHHVDFDDCDDTESLREGLSLVRNLLKRRKIVDITKPGFDKGIDCLAELFKLNYVERCIIQFFVYIANNQTFRRMISRLNEVRYGPSPEISIRDEKMLSILTGLKVSEIVKALQMDGVLLSSGLLKMDTDGELTANSSVARNMMLHIKSVEELKNNLLGKELVGDMNLDFFNVKEGYDYIKCLVQKSVSKNIKGMNILVYGSTGTGKSEMVKQIVTSLGYKLYGLHSSDKHKEEKDVALSYLMFAQRILTNDKNSVIVVDEAEDVFSYNTRSDSAVSKLFLNQLLEKNKRPVIWITNCIDCMDRAYLRRFAYCYEFKKPDDKTKCQIWRNICKRYKLNLSDAEIQQYSKKYDVAPGIIDMGVRVAKMTKLPNAITNTIDSMCLAMTGRRPKNPKPAAVDFDPKLLNTDTDMMRLTEQLKSGKSRNFSLCLYGASGTGKSAYARYLAEQLGIEVIQKRASDLQDKYVGETEKLIARAFEEAKAKNAMLVFDEADSFLRDRSRASHSWEVSAVNEMLTQMENSGIPFVCTTNLMSDIDAASLRRFVFKIKYEFMTPTQVKTAFQDFFNIKVEDADIRGLNALAPGDFAVVKSKADILGNLDKKALIDMLRAEISVKNVRESKKIGF